MHFFLGGGSKEREIKKEKEKVWKLEEKKKERERCGVEVAEAKKTICYAP